MSNKFTCSACQKTFEKAGSDQEALTDAKERGVDMDSAAIVCDDCFKFMTENIGLTLNYGEKVLVGSLVIREMMTIKTRLSGETLSQFQIDMLTKVGSSLSGILDKLTVPEQNRPLNELH